MSSIKNILKTGTPNDCSNTKRLIRDAVIEFVATTLFIYCGTLSALSTGTMLLLEQHKMADVARILPIAICFGISILFLVHSIGHLSGGHMNPAVTLLMFFKQQISVTKMVIYWLSQFSGALFASALVWGSTSSLAGIQVNEDNHISHPPFFLGNNTVNPNISSWNAFLLELVGSFIFFFVIAQTALDKRGLANTHFPALPIGLSLVVVHIGLIPFTGCGVNPARTFGPSVMSCLAGSCGEAIQGTTYWIYYIAPGVAAFLVAETTNMLSVGIFDIDLALHTDEKKVLNV